MGTSEQDNNNKPPKKGANLAIYLRLLTYVKPMWFYFVLSVMGYMVFAASQAAIAHVMKYFIDALQGDFSHPVYYVPLIAVGIRLLTGIGSFFGRYYIAKVGQEVVHTLRCEVFDKMIVFPTATFDNTNSGHLISRITFNVTMVMQAVSNAVTVIVREGLTVIALLAYLLYMNWQLTLIFLVLGPFLGLIMSLVGKRMRKLSHRIQAAMGEVTHVASEAINGFKVMRSYGGEKYEKTRFLRASNENRKQNLKIERTNAIATPVTQFIVAIAMGVVMLLVLLLKNDGTEVSDLVAYITAVGLLPKPLKQLTNVYSTIQKGIAGAESIFDHLDQASEQDAGSQELERVSGKIDIINLNLTYPGADSPALNDINLSVNSGESVAIVGRSGSGKSSLVNLIPRFYHHEEGSILIDGVDVEDFKLVNLRQHIALVTQHVSLFNDTVFNNIAYGDLADCSADQVYAAAKAAHADEFIRQLPDGYDTLIGEDGVLLSGGQRQRLSIARALLKDAPILILDEATSALDTESERYIQAALDAVMKNRTTLIIAHRLSTIESADRIVVLDKGRIIEQGSHAQLLKHQGAYATLHKMQFSEESDAGTV